MLVLTRAATAALLLVPLALLGMGVADVAAFNARAAALEQSWSADEASGVGAGQLAPARSSLQALRDRRLAAVLPYSALSGALLFDPFGTPEQLAQRTQARALAQQQRRARDDLARLKDLGGPNWTGLAVHTAQLAAAHRLPDYFRLATAWEAEATQMSGVRDQLSQASGGLADGLPKDVVDGVARLQFVASAATQASLSPAPADQALAHAQQFLKLAYPDQLQQHSAVAGEVRSAGDTVQARLDTRAEADQLLALLPDLLSQATKYSVTGSLPTQATQARGDVQASEASGDDARMAAATAALKQVEEQLSTAVAGARQQAAQAALQAASIGACIDGAPAQLIVIHLATQQLIAYNNGCPMLHTPVTTGRPALPTDRGTFHIFAKYPTYHMISPWPQGSPFWYHDAWVSDAMEFVSDGTFLHSASWEPASAYGAGSENGPYASHGCVHVQDGPLAQLYAWAQIGTTVVVED